MRLHHLAEQLEAMIREAKDTPILGGARLDRDRVYDLVDQMRDSIEFVRLDDERGVYRGAGALVPLDELDDVIHNAKTVPLTGSVRVDREELAAIIGRIRHGASQDRMVTGEEAEQPPIDRRRVRGLLDRLDKLVQSAKPVPLTTQMRIDVKPAREILGELRECGPVAMLPAVDALDDTLHNAFPVPLTDQVRVERGRLTEIIQQMRAGFSQGTPPALTN